MILILIFVKSQILLGYIFLAYQNIVNVQHFIKVSNIHFYKLSLCACLSQLKIAIMEVEHNIYKSLNSEQDFENLKTIYNDVIRNKQQHVHVTIMFSICPFWNPR